MSDAAEKLKPMLDAPSVDDRAALAQYLIYSPPVPDEEVSVEEAEAAWAPVINRRVEGVTSGKVKGVPAEQLFPELREPPE